MAVFPKSISEQNVFCVCCQSFTLSLLWQLSNALHAFLASVFNRGVPRAGRTRPWPGAFIGSLFGGGRPIRKLSLQTAMGGPVVGIQSRSCKGVCTGHTQVCARHCCSIIVRISCQINVCWLGIRIPWPVWPLIFDTDQWFYFCLCSSRDLWRYFLLIDFPIVSFACTVITVVVVALRWGVLEVVHRQEKSRRQRSVLTSRVVYQGSMRIQCDA